MTRIVALEHLAGDWVAAHDGDAAALARLNAHYERDFTAADVRAEIWRRVYAYRQRSSRVPRNVLEPDEARLLIAQDVGHGSWEALLAAGGAPPTGSDYDLDDAERSIAPRRRLSSAEWDDLLAVARERRVTGLDARGLMTDSLLPKVATLEHVTSLSLAGSRELGDDGLRALARMPQLERLELGGRITDRGLAVLRQLPALREIEMPWQGGVTDDGVAHLAACGRLERVNLMGTTTGDGAIGALEGKPHLRNLSTGREVTDAGVRRLASVPRLAMPPTSDGGFTLLLDGPFTNDGLASLAGLAGLEALDLFWHASAITPAGFAGLAAAPHLAALGADGRLADDTALTHMATMPRLTRLRMQEAVASDDGFVALGRSRSLETIWGRECAGFGDRGFLAFAAMPALRSLGIGLAGISHHALAALSSFAALRELTPIGLVDEQFVHVGACAGLERLVCMYCRESGDVATAHVAQLGLRSYYAGLTRITDRSLELLGAMPTLEQVELYECRGVTDTGLGFLAQLPRLREVSLDGLPGVTLEGTRVFAHTVRVRHSN